MDGWKPAAKNSQLAPQSPSKTPQENPIHPPLDHNKASIRLLGLSPNLSSRGEICCETICGTLEDDYIGMSYVWGDEEPGEWIILNQKPF
jgi:hypothetical protein